MKAQIDFDREQVLKWAKEITYKKDVELTFEVDSSFLDMRISRRGPDIRSPEDALTIVAHHRVPFRQIYSLYMLAGWVYHNILNFERHEADEWFKVSGVAVKDPHRNEI